MVRAEAGRRLLRLARPLRLTSLGRGPEHAVLGCGVRPGRGPLLCGHRVQTGENNESTGRYIEIMPLALNTNPFRLNCKIEGRSREGG